MAETACQCLRCLRENGETTDMLGMQVSVADAFFIVCAICGNKRCPHANDHRHACTGSNEPGQPGSAYGPAIKEVSNG